MLDGMASSSLATIQIQSGTMETLINLKEDYSHAPLLTTGWDISADGTTYTFPLRQGVLFHNGKEMTADDVVASTKRFLEVTTRAAQFALLDSYTAADKYTVVFKLKKPSAAFLDALVSFASGLYIMPKEIIEGKKANELTVADMIGTGPYKLVEAKLGDYVRTVRFDKFVPLPEPGSGMVGGKIPYFDEIIWYSVPEAATRVAGIETGTYDWVEALPATAYDELKASAGVTPYVSKPCDWMIYLFPNHADKFAGNVKFRQAIAAMLDMDEIGMAVTGGVKEFYTLDASLWVPESTWHVEDETAKKLYNEKNLDKAKQLLKESGYAGEQINMSTNKSYDWMYKTVLSAADQMQKKLGINTNVVVMDWAAQQKQWDETAGWQFSISGVRGQAIAAPGDLVGYWSSKTKGGLNLHYNNPAMDKLVEEEQAAATTEQRKAAYAKIQALYYTEFPWMKTITTYGLEAHRSNIVGIRPWYRSFRFWNVWRS